MRCSTDSCIKLKASYLLCWKRKLCLYILRLLSAGGLGLIHPAIVTTEGPAGSQLKLFVSVEAGHNL